MIRWEDPRPDEDNSGSILWAPVAILIWIVAIALIARAAFSGEWTG